jgi:hypothetical protein
VVIGLDFHPSLIFKGGAIVVELKCKAVFTFILLVGPQTRGLYYKTYYSCTYKLERLPLASFSSLVQCLRVGLGLTQVKHLSDAPL